MQPIYYKKDMAVEIWVAIIVAVIGPAIITLLQKNINGFQFTKDVENDRKIFEILNTIKKEYHADRVAILQYHNGGNFYSGKSRQKVSMTHESYKETITKSLLHKFQDLPVSYFNSMAYHLVKEDKLIQLDVSQIEDIIFKRVLDEHDVKIHVSFGIYKKYVSIFPNKDFLSEKQKMVASLHLFFLNEDQKPRLEKSSYITVSSSISELTNLLK